MGTLSDVIWHGTRLKDNIISAFNDLRGINPTRNTGTERFFTEYLQKQYIHNNSNEI